VIELLADLLAERLAHFAAARAKPFRFTERVLGADAHEAIGKFLAAAVALAWLAVVRGLFARRWFGRRFVGFRRVVRRCHFGEEPRLIRIEAFRFWAVQFSQQEIEPLLHAFA